MEKIVLVKKDGKLEVMNMNDSIQDALDGVHLCWGDCPNNFCKNADINNCPKVNDRKKKTMDKYDFITEGVQVLDDKGDIDQFVVKSCEKYEPVGEKKITKEQRKSAREAKAGIMTYYFDAETLEEAQIKQYMQMIRGELRNVEGKTLDHATMITKILERDNAEELLKEVRNYLAGKRSVGNEVINYLNREIAKLETTRKEKENSYSMNIAYLKKKGKDEGKIN